MKTMKEDFKSRVLLVPRRVTAVRLARVMTPFGFRVRYPQGASS
jgi:hypothetical protein